MRSYEYIKKWAESQPTKIALEDEKGTIDYATYSDYAQRIATGVLGAVSGGQATDGSDSTKSVQEVADAIYPKNEPIAVFVGRNAMSVVAMMGVSMTGNFYVPIDGSQPAPRIATILQQMQPIAIVIADEKTDAETIKNITSNTDNENPEQSDDGAQIVNGNNVPILATADLIAHDADTALLSQIAADSKDDDLIYAICTSGSTGVPKGVIKAHYSVEDFIPVFCRTFDLKGDDVFANQAPFDFDVSGKDIYSSLYLGATLYVVPTSLFASPKKLIATLNEKHVTVLTWAVSALCVASGMNAFNYETPQYVRRVMFSGEVMPIAVLNKWKEVCPDAMYVNLYGPTEVTNNCTYYIVDREFDVTEKLPLGRVFDHQTVRFLNSEGQEIKKGEQGELCVSGPSIALGYYRDPERTAQAFVTGPDGERMLRTGDMVEIHDDGEYYFVGRRDFQVKHMGHRVELEEVELYLNATDGVDRAGCLFDRERDKIVCVYSGEADKRTIAVALRDQIPKYMQPNVYIAVDTFPLNKNGKIDRNGIRAVYERQV